MLTGTEYTWYSLKVIIFFYKGILKWPSMALILSILLLVADLCEQRQTLKISIIAYPPIV